MSIKKTIQYKVTIENLFKNLSENIFEEYYNSDYDGIYGGSIDKIENSSFAGGYKLGNDMNTLFEGGVKLELNDKSELISKDNNIYICENNNEAILAKEKDVKNMCVVDNGEKYLYYTSKNIVKRLNLTTFRKEYVEGLKDVKAEKMCSVDDNYLYYISDGNICVYDIKNNKTEVKESAEGITNYIPTSFGIIKLVNSGEEVDIIANGNNVKECFNGLYKEDLYEKFRYVGIDNDYLYIQIKLLETELELEKTLTYKIEVKQLFNNMSASSFEECYNSDYDKLDRNLDLNYSEDNFIGEYRLGTSMENFFEGGRTLQLSNIGKLVSKDNTIAYVDEEHDNSIIAKEKNVANMCFMQSGNTGYVYYTVNGVVKRINLSSYGKEYVDKLQDIRVDKMCSVDDHILYYVSDDKIYSFDLNNGSINQIDKIDKYEKFLPTQYGLVWFGDVDGYDFESILVNNNCISQYFNELDELVDKDYSVEKYRFNKEYLYVDFNVDDEEIAYWISINDLFNSLSGDKFKYVDKDELYNYLNNNKKISMRFTAQGQEEGLYYLGNNYDKILDGGKTLELEDGCNIEIEGDKIIYKDDGESVVLTEGCRKAKNLNIWASDWSSEGGKVYYSSKNKIKSIDIYTGNVTTELCLSKSEVIDMMYVVDNREIWYSVKNIIYRFVIKYGNPKEYLKEEGLQHFIPANNTIIKVKKVQQDSEESDLVLEETSLVYAVCNYLQGMEELNCLNGEIRINTYSIKNGYLEFNVEDNNENSVKIRISIEEGNPLYSEDYLLENKRLTGWYVRNWNNTLLKQFGLNELSYNYDEKIIEQISDKAINGKNIQLSDNKSISYDSKSIKFSCNDEQYILYECTEENATIDDLVYDYASNNIHFFESKYYITLDLNSGNIDRTDFLYKYKDSTRSFFKNEIDKNKEEKLKEQDTEKKKQIEEIINKNQEKINKLDREENFNITKMYIINQSIKVVLIGEFWYRLKYNDMEILLNSPENIEIFIPISNYKSIGISKDLSQIYICDLDSKQFECKNYCEDLIGEVKRKEFSDKTNISLELEKFIYDDWAYAVINCTDNDDESNNEKVMWRVDKVESYIDLYRYYIEK